MEALAGSYTADRAAALSGVPKSTMHYWARKGYVIPSVSAEKRMLWSYADLLKLRTVQWLRRWKTHVDGNEIPGSTMPAVLHALDMLKRLDLDILDDDRRPRIMVSGSGDVIVETPTALETATGQIVDPNLMDPIAPFQTIEGVHGPDLVRPRPLLRIRPRKLAGSPHVWDTRLETRAIGALAARGFTPDEIGGMYPGVPPDGIREALELETDLRQNLRLSRAA